MDGGGIEFGGEVDDVVFVSHVGAVFVSPFVSPTNEDILLRKLVMVIIPKKTKIAKK